MRLKLSGHLSGRGLAPHIYESRKKHSAGSIGSAETGLRHARLLNDSITGANSTALVINSI